MFSRKEISFDKSIPYHVLTRAVEGRKVFANEEDCFRCIFQMYAANIGSPASNLRRQDVKKAAQAILNGEEIPPKFIVREHPPLVIFLSFALAYAEAIAASKIYIGVNALDYSGYPDCRPDYIQAIEEVFRLGTKQGREGDPITIESPLIHLKKTEIIKLGNRLGVPWEFTWSCYAGEEQACGVCDSCRLRLAAFAELELIDPIAYIADGNREQGTGNRE